jgi:hypothetical protein
MTKQYVSIVVADYWTGSIPTTLGVSTLHGSRIVSVFAIFPKGSCHTLNKTGLEWCHALNKMVLDGHVLCCDNKMLQKRHINMFVFQRYKTDEHVKTLMQYLTELCATICREEHYVCKDGLFRIRSVGTNSAM